MRAIIIDDEKHSTEILQMLIETECPEVELVGIEHDPNQAIQLINRKEPEILFLDIEMPGMNGFELLQSLENNQPHVIFTTAYDEFALKAFRVGAIDYLLKPISKEELTEAVGRVKERIQQNHPPVDLRDVVQSIYQKEPIQSRIPVSTIDGIEFIPVEDIIRCQSNSNYTEIHTKKGKLMLSKTLKQVEKQLIEHDCFFRVHHSHLINLNYIAKYMKGSGGTIEMTNGDKVNVARNKKQELMEVLNLS